MKRKLCERTDIGANIRRMVMGDKGIIEVTPIIYLPKAFSKIYKVVWYDNLNEITFQYLIYVFFVTVIDKSIR